MTLNPGEFQWLYKAKILDIYDGDTLSAEIDLGFNIKTNRKIRLYGINAPELRGKEKENGIRARNVLREWILNKDVIIESIKDKSGKYGRILAKIWFQQEHPNNKEKQFLMCANSMLVSSSLAKEAYY